MMQDNKIITKIVATIGPATLDTNIYKKLVEQGIDFIRINSLYGDYEQYDKILANRDLYKDIRQVEVIYDIKSLDKLDYALHKNIKYIAVSFTESPDDLEKVRDKITDAFVIAKIESVRGVENFDEILAICDGIMIARGDLGVAVSLEKVPPLQKSFSKKAIQSGKFLITATEMLLSMVDNPKPTRAEVSDVANAVFEGSNAVMLSEETAIGKYPIEVVGMMKKIIIEAEKWRDS